MKAYKQEVPTPPVEKIYEVVLTMTPEEANQLKKYLIEGGEKESSEWDDDYRNDPRYKVYIALRDAR